MAVSGFEGFEKRLELQFSGDNPVIGMGGLRQLGFESLEEVLSAVQCTVVAAVGNQYFDSYVLSESSLFVYPTKIIIKTCGTTQLLKAVCPMIEYGREIGLTLSCCRYTRGNFIFPQSQPYPHTSFKDEVVYLEGQLPSHLCFRKASILPSKTGSKTSSHSWHVFTATDITEGLNQPVLNNGQRYTIDRLNQNDGQLYTIEVCMTELDQVQAGKFFGGPGTLGVDMTDVAGISHINPRSIICDYAFHPCGYSMNGVDFDRYSTIHVTPEDGFSYASYECVGSTGGGDDIGRVMRKVVKIFRPGAMSVAVTGNNEAWKRVAKAVEPLGMKCRSVVVDEFPAAGKVTFLSFSPRRN